MIVDEININQHNLNLSAIICMHLNQTEQKVKETELNRKQTHAISNIVKAMKQTFDKYMNYDICRLSRAAFFVKNKKTKNQIGLRLGMCFFLSDTFITLSQ